MKKNFLMLAVLAFFGTAIVSCGDDDETTTTTPTTSTFSLSVTGLEDLGSGYAYEGWIMVDGAPVSTGTFTVTGNTPSQTSFEVAATDLESATAFILSIEPVPDSDPAPSAVKLLGGDFSGNAAALSVAHGAALGTDFSSAAGNYILATPTNGADSDENSGVWWLDPSSGTKEAGLTLPTLPSGWKYEGWAVVDGTPVSTGTFTNASGADSAAPFSGTMDAPPFPGEDFLLNAPNGLTFPVDLSGMPVVISVEPSPDNSPAPFTLKPLFHTVSATATSGTVYAMDNNATATNPAGTVTR